MLSNSWETFQITRRLQAKKVKLQRVGEWGWLSYGLLDTIRPGLRPTKLFRQSAFASGLPDRSGITETLTKKRRLFILPSSQPRPFATEKIPPGTRRRILYQVFSLNSLTVAVWFPEASRSSMLDKPTEATAPTHGTEPRYPPFHDRTLVSVGVTSGRQAGYPIFQ
jgi:hypothetical protein